jgi:hypothetical protein
VRLAQTFSITQVTATVVTSTTPTVPEPLETRQRWTGAVGWVATVTAKMVASGCRTGKRNSVAPDGTDKSLEPLS